MWYITLYSSAVSSNYCVLLMIGTSIPISGCYFGVDTSDLLGQYSYKFNSYMN